MKFEEILLNFNKIYRSLIFPKLAPIEKERLEIINRYKKEKIISIISGILAFLFTFVLIQLYWQCAFVGVVFIIFAFKYGFSSYCLKYDFSTKIKALVLPEILRIFGDFKVKRGNDIIAICANSIKNPKSKEALSKEIYQTSDIELDEICALGFCMLASSKEDDDSIVGTYKNLNLTILETRLTHTTTDSEGHRHTVVDFKGLIIKTNLNFKYQGITILKDKKGLDYNPKNLKLETIKLEDCELEKRYKIYSDDQVEARYLLNPSLMEKIKNANAIFKAKAISFAIVDNLLYIFINSNNNFFEVGTIEKKVYDEARIKKVLEEIVAIFKLIRHFNLTQKRPNKSAF